MPEIVFTARNVARPAGHTAATRSAAWAPHGDVPSLRAAATRGGVACPAIRDPSTEHGSPALTAVFPRRRNHESNDPHPRDTGVRPGGGQGRLHGAARCAPYG